MPIIKSSADLRNNYNSVSQQAHEYDEPIFITKNGKGDIAVMSIESYERMRAKLEIYEMIAEGLEDVQEERIEPIADAMREIEDSIKR